MGRTIIRRKPTVTMLALTLASAFAGPSASADQKRLAVLEFHGKDVEPEVLATMSDNARAGALTTKGRAYDVMTRESMAVMIQEMGGAAKCEEGECEVETARNIGAHFVITGQVVLVEETYIVTLKLHETAKGTLLATQQVQGKGQLDVLNHLQSAARTMMQEGLGLVEGGPAIAPKEPGAATTAPNLATVPALVAAAAARGEATC